MLRVHEKASAKAGEAEPKSIKEAYDRLPDKGKCLIEAVKLFKNIPTAIAFKRDDNMIELSYCRGENDIINSKQLKKAINEDKINVVNMQIDKAGRMTRKAINLKLIVRENSEKAPLEYVEQQVVIIYGLAYIEAINIQKKKELLMYIKNNFGMDAEDISKLVTVTNYITYEWYSYLDTMCRDNIIRLFQQMAK